ncbi:hypothetical protein BB560_004548 [Smittium megazygosporum]|uniref:Probable metalloprotease ARX1 n=1 Tax=Smittium megazygosporum TaxID=133381 RepID=A0A2T9Z8X9_9FUNG|nr:hypothetical protein BB560_004548 [Smittium megazygosporum]
MNQDSQEKYRFSATIAQTVLEKIVNEIKPGCSVHALCRYGDELVNAYTKSVFKNLPDIERGIAFPTTISINNYIQNFSPDKEDDVLLSPGDLVKIETSAQIDGFIGNAAYSYIIPLSMLLTPYDKIYYVTSAAYFALEAGIRLFSPGNTSTNVINAIQAVANEFKCSVSEHSYTTHLDRFVFSGKKTFSNSSHTKSASLVTTFESGDVYSVDVILSTGPGVSKTSEYKPTIFSRNLNKSYQLKLKSSRLLFSKVCKQRSVFPFLLRDLVEKDARAGLFECTQNDLLIPYAVSTERNGEYVAQFKTTVFVHPSGPLRLIASTKPNLDLPNSIENNEISALLNTPLKQVAPASLKSNIKIDPEILDSIQVKSAFSVQKF